MLAIGQIDYLNCTPIFTMLRRQGAANEYRFAQGVPSDLNRQLRAGAIDVCPSSSIEYGRYPDHYYILPDLSISADGPVKSVMLFSRPPIEELAGRAVGLTSESETSVVLLKILLARFYGFTNIFTPLADPLAADGSQPSAHLLIGDTALREAATRTGWHVYDLGELWHRFTGLPFVFALWLVRREAVQAEPAAVRRLLGQLLAAKSAAQQSYPEIAAHCGEVTWLSHAALVEYWQTISYDLTARHRDGVRLFFRYGAECGIIPAVPDLALFED